MIPPDDSSIGDERLAELSALADGTLPPHRRAAVETWIAGSEELGERFDRERKVVELLREARERDHAPDALRARIERAHARSSSRARGPRAYAAAAAATVAVAAAILLAIVLPGGAPALPTVSQAAGLAAQGPARGAPSPDPEAPSGRLAQAVDDVYFPNWTPTLGWRATGQRTDRLDGHRAITVYYRLGAQRVAYTIISLPALAQPSGAVVWEGAVRLHVVSHGRRVLVTWRRAGHTCILSSSGATASELERLAGWRPPVAT